MSFTGNHLVASALVLSRLGLALLCTSAFLIAQDYSIFIGCPAPAVRVEAVAGGGHFPVMIRLDNGTLGAAVRGGATHVGVRGRLDWISSKDGGKTWDRKLLVDSPLDDRNPAVGQLQDGTVVVSYHIAGGYGPNGEVPSKDSPVIRDGLWVVRSTDRGATWQKPFKSPVPLELGASGYGKIVQLTDGTALMAVYYLTGSPRRNISYVYRSRDRGTTWGEPSKISDESDETALVVLPSNRLMAVLRSQFGAHLSTSFSEDKGRTWSRPKQITSDKEHPADIILLKDGRLLLSYGERNHPFGVRAKISKNLGVDWEPDIFVLASDADNGDCGYPSSAEVSPGKIVTLYYGVSGAYDPYGKDPTSLSRTYARAVLWSLPN